MFVCVRACMRTCVCVRLCAVFVSSAVESHRNLASRCRNAGVTTMRARRQPLLCLPSQWRCPAVQELADRKRAKRVASGGFASWSLASPSLLHLQQWCTLRLADPGQCRRSIFALPPSSRKQVGVHERVAGEEVWLWRRVCRRWIAGDWRYYWSRQEAVRIAHCPLPSHRQRCVDCGAAPRVQLHQPKCCSAGQRGTCCWLLVLRYERHLQGHLPRHGQATAGAPLVLWYAAANAAPLVWYRCEGWPDSCPRRVYRFQRC